MKTLEQVAADYGLTPDGVAFALEQYQRIITEITHGMLSKLSYRACDVLQMAQELWCDTCELKIQQEPVEPKVDIDTYICGNCGHKLEHQELLGDNILFHEQYEYCPNCGKRVKYE